MYCRISLGLPGRRIPVTCPFDIEFNVIIIKFFYNFTLVVVIIDIDLKLTFFLWKNRKVGEKLTSKESKHVLIGKNYRNIN